jgi:transcriptional regulator with GAF, ATPase, and Fis domain
MPTPPRAPGGGRDPRVPFVYASETMGQLVDLIARAARSQAKVLITGESGVGKDLIAREIHRQSVRADRPFVALNCAGLPENLLESELFGHLRGSFTGALKDRPGKLQLAHRGTLFLDEVGDMSPRLQVLLLRFLESGELQTVGADYLNPVADVRVIAATNHDLVKRVRERQFREDLFYRLRVIHVRVPPLRDRLDDIPVLVAHFLNGLHPAVTLSDQALALLKKHSWPGNVRELQNVVEQARWLSDSSVIDVEHLLFCLDSNLPDAAAQTPALRRDLADELFESLVDRSCSFWDDVHPMFLSRDLTRHDLREVLRRGLAATGGNYRALLGLFGMPEQDYKRLLNFLSAHDCNVDVRPYREAQVDRVTRLRPVLRPAGPLGVASPAPEEADEGADQPQTRWVSRRPPVSSGAV